MYSGRVSVAGTNLLAYGMRTNRCALPSRKHCDSLAKRLTVGADRGPVKTVPISRTAPLQTRCWVRYTLSWQTPLVGVNCQCGNGVRSEMRSEERRVGKNCR